MFKSKIQLENMSEEDREKELKRAEEYVKDLKRLMKPKIPLDVKPLTFEDISHIKEEHLNEIIEKKKYTKEYPKLVKQLVHLLYKNKSNRNFILHNKKYFILTEPGKLEQISLNDLNTKIIYNTFDKINMCFDINYTDILAERTGYEDEITGERAGFRSRMRLSGS